MWRGSGDQWQARYPEPKLGIKTPAPMTMNRRLALQWLLPPILFGLSGGSLAQGHMGPFRLEGINGSIGWNPGAVDKAWLYLDFWASWCGPCRLSFPWMNRLHDQWSAKGLRIVAVTVDRKREDALGFLKANPARFEIAFDPQAVLARTLDVKTMPTSLLVAPDGRIVHRHEGFTASLGDKAARSVQEAVGGAA